MNEEPKSIRKKSWAGLTLFACACLVTLVALFYAEEDWRGWHAWNKFKQEWEAKGEKFNFADFVPPPVPDDQNFALTPIVFSGYGQILTRDGKAIPPDKRDTNFVNRLKIEIVHNYEDSPKDGNWQIAKTSDLKPWRNYYRALSATTNEFSIAPQPQSPAADVLLALSKYDLAIEELRQASQLPHSRFPLDYDIDDPAEILLPHLYVLKQCSLALQLRAIAELQNGQSEKAFADVTLALRLMDSVRTEPFIITHLVRIAILQITLQPVWEGLAEHKWSDVQLAELDSELSKLDFLADYEFSARSERAAHVKIVDWLEQKRSRFWRLFNMIDNDAKKTMNSFGLSVEIYLMPKGWYYQSEIVLSKVQQQWVLPMVNDLQQTVSPQAARESVDAVGPLRPTGVNLFARLLLPELGKYAERTAYGQNAANLARVAIALERYRLAHGEFPEALATLTPQFMEKLPHDVINGQPLRYRREANGQFVLYSVGWNETDDGGEFGFKADGSVDISQSDWVWRYPAK
jgi:tetratricopeptide (TPR) repeat protein